MKQKLPSFLRTITVLVFLLHCRLCHLLFPHVALVRLETADSYEGLLRLLFLQGIKVIGGSALLFLGCSAILVKL